ncbi:Hsp70 family protein [Arthrobacter sp. BE255]|uniref:Hsp70 family protein n=1 Tax=Arthrobacter sp. BE255 TaxID=2817721 RepID=UPI00286A3DEB|nr:Hsp70 family protein [Arthrobacter sp. BE255]
MSYVLAIDVGTSFTAAAIARTDRIAPPVPESLPLGLRGTSVPSVIYYPEEGPILVGESAERRGLDSPDRVVREFKRRIGDNVPIAVGTLSLPAEEVFATMAGWVVDRAAEREGEPPSQIILSHPAAWGGHRIAVIQEALTARGIHDVMLVSEPEAAALHYASQVRVEDGSTIAVYDLGGGTFDTAILKKADAGHFEFLGRPEGIEDLGGADFDAAVLRHVAAHTGEAFTALDPADPAAMAALSRLRRECVEAKEALSADSEASISVFLPAVHQQVRLVRSELEAMIEEPIRETVDSLERSLDELGLEADDLTAVLLIGGSSRIPLVAQLISEQLDRPIAVDADPKSSICLGAVVAALRARPVAVVSAVTEDSVTAWDISAGVAAAVAALDPATKRTLPNTALTNVALTSVALTNVEPHGDSRRASWSRKPGAAFGSLAGTGDMSVGARGHSGAHAGAHAPGAKAGQHSPRPTVRLTAVAAAAAMLTVLTATAAQSPDGLGSLTAMFTPQVEGSANGSVAAAAADPGGPAPAGVGAAGAAAGAAGGAQAPLRGLEANAKKSTDKPAGTAGIESAASPTSRPSDSSPAAASAGNGDGAAAAGTTLGETGGAPSDPTQGTGGSETPTTNPDPTTDPVPDPTTDPPVPDPDPTTPAPDPDPTTPAPDPDPTTPAPDPTTPAPDPDPTTPAPDPTTPAPDPDPTTPAPDPTTDPPAPTADPVPIEPVI